MTKDDCNCHKKDVTQNYFICHAGNHHIIGEICNCPITVNYGYADLIPDETNPAHYSVGDEQVWDFIARKKLDYFEGNVVKYVCRSPYKGEQIKDLKKAIAYLRKKIELVEAQRSGT